MYVSPPQLKNNQYHIGAIFCREQGEKQRGGMTELLEQLSTVEEVMGFVAIVGPNNKLTDLNFLRNLRKINGCKLFG